MSLTSNVYFPIDLFSHYEDVEIIKYKLEKFSYRLQSKLTRDEFDYIIRFTIRILYEYFDKDGSLFFTKKQLRKYIKFTMVVSFWISYKFLADEDDIYASDIADILKIKTKELLDKEREILLFINYNLFKFLKNFNTEIFINKD